MFITPFGRYSYNRLCFRISSAPEHFQKRMQQVLEGLEGVLCQMDDVLIWGATQIKFLGQIIEASGISADPDKVSAVRAMNELSNVSEVRRFLGMTNHLGKFLPHLAERTRPLRDLLKKSNMWTWGLQQQQAFDSIKQELTTPPGLALVPGDSTTEGLREEEINLYADSVIASLPATEKRLREIQTHQDNDDILRQLKQYCVEGWPDKFSIG
ncbi:hypothetical protein AAFF_G00316220 [Aldrovandia affinis]|uniref:Reverse transcriptase/retrotransposon-derived protein RNase H-like domain-containing protein n=1 Tax=Aldrovandia affinis TaxID=143900 RepID=A0AAD7WQK8_9TELE|nr:hypothetical protein AAFF_G00316220 [Aldrovandia affinis]